MFRLRKQRPLFLGVSLVLAVITVCFLLSRAYTQTSSQNSLNSSQSHSFSTNPASWIVTPASFNNTIVHYSIVSSSYSRNERKNQNDTATKGDIWSQMDATGRVVKFHAVYTSLDGKTFLQEDYEDTSERVIVFAKDTLDASERLSPQDCIVQQPIPPSGLSASLRVPFVNEALLEENASRMRVGIPTHTLPITPSSRFKPHTVYGTSSSRSVHIWEKMEHDRTGKEIGKQMLEVDSQGRLLVSESDVLDASNIVTNRTWQSYGSLYVYDPLTIPTTVFSTVKQIRAEGCIR